MRWRDRGGTNATPSHDHLVRLGSHETLPPGVGGKAALLHRCARAGLRIPTGFVLLDEVRTADVATDVGALFPPGTLLAVRSAFSGEDTAGQSRAGHYESVLRVPADDPAAVRSALSEVWASADADHLQADRGPAEPDADSANPDSAHPDAGEPGSAHPDSGMRRDVLIMEMVDAVHAGVAALQEDYEDDLVEAVEGTAEGLVGGTATDVRRVMLPRLRGFERAHRGPDRVPLPFWAMRMSAMLAELRAVVGDGDWDVEWADDGETCWLLQVRPLTAPVRRRETLAVSNFREILPELPSPFMTSLIAERAPATFDLYRAFDPDLPSGRPFATVVEGRPFLNMSLLEDMLRRYGLPTGMLVGAMGGESITRARLRPARVAKNSPTLLRMAITQLRAPSRVQETAAGVERAAADARAAGTATALVDAAGEAYATLLTGMVSLATFIGPGMALLRAFGTLAVHAEGHLTETTVMWEDLTRVQSGALTRGDWLRRHGHRGVYETDFARPRFAESPQLLDALAGHARPPSVPARHPRDVRVRAVTTRPLWEATARAVRAREWLRSETMRSFAEIREGLLAKGDELVAEGALAHRDDLWLLTVSEVRSLDQGWRPDPGLPDRRRAELAELARHELPDVIPGDHQVVVPPGSSARARAVAGAAAGGSLLIGLGLTDGEVEGVAWVCASPTTDLPDDAGPGPVILVTRTVDAGWLPTFAVVDGVVVEIGGDLSHGSILLREIGMPSVTNCRGALATIHTGDRIRVRAHRGRVEILAAPRPGGS